MNGILVQMLQFADDITMLADSEENLKKMPLNFVKTLKQKYNMKMGGCAVPSCGPPCK